MFPQKVERAWSTTVEQSSLPHLSFRHLPAVSTRTARCPMALSFPHPVSPHFPHLPRTPPLTSDMPILNVLILHLDQPHSTLGWWKLPKFVNLLVCSERAFGEGNSNPLQYSCLENPVDVGAWWAAVHGVTQNRTWLKQLSVHACIGEGNGNPLQYSCLENPRDGRAWWAAVYGGRTESDTTEVT